MDPITTIATVPAIVACVNVGKRLGLPPRIAILAALVLGVALSLATWAWDGQGWWEAASSGLLMGLAASGVYDLMPSAPAPQVAIDQPDAVVELAPEEPAHD